MGKRWITIDCILPAVEMMDDRSHGIDLWKRAYTSLAWLIIGATHPEDAEIHKKTDHILHSIRVFQLFSCSYNFDTVVLNSSVVTCLHIFVQIQWL